jgi:hypothetical protein
MVNTLVAFKVESSGKWAITIEPISSARTWTGTGTLSGKGDDVAVIGPAVSGLTTVNIVNHGQDNFVVTSYSTDRSSDRIVNEIGNYNGQNQLADGTALLQIESDGTWSIAP